MEYIRFFNDSVVSNQCISEYGEKAKKISESLHSHEFGMDGFVDYPSRVEDALLEDIKRTADNIRKESDVLIVLGIGGSYLGAKAMTEMLGEREGAKTEVIFAGCNLSSCYHRKIFRQIECKDFSLLVISKSGSTVETKFAFSVFKQELEKRYGKAYKSRIYAITDKTEGELCAECSLEGYKSYELEKDIGGRYSVLTPVGLLPAAVCGYDINAIIKGAYLAQEKYNNTDVLNNDCLKYAISRRVINGRLGKDIEAYVFFEPRMISFGEWLKQLFAESEGKEGVGIFPVSLFFSTDLHSLGQYLQDGKENFYETFIYTESTGSDISSESMPVSMNEYNKIVYKSAFKAHSSKGTPVMRMEISECNEESFGFIVYFFEKACAVSGLLLGVNPFNQPGVEIYKSEMKKALKDHCQN